MSPKFWFRTFRNLAVRNRPYFAHLALTHRCNLRCHFCHIPEKQVPEQDTAGIKRIIDRLDQLGVAVLSISGGGEPLLRPDFATILNYAADKGLYTKITSNGTMSVAKYAELLASRVAEIAISLDGVQGNDLPHSHVGPKILESLRYLNDQLPKGKRLTVNITVSSNNREQAGEIVAYCTREFPRARLWLNPVVVGVGKLRVPSELKVNPDFLRQIDSPTLLAPSFYKQGCEDYYRHESYNWGCLAGELFFDIKPDGEFWMCQDHPSPLPLNILNPDFEAKRRKADFGSRRQCSGCTYSCYWLTQKSFQPAAWPGMAGVWWKSNTQPGEPCRQTAEKRGHLAGFLHFSLSRLFPSSRLLGRLTAPLVLFLALTAAPLALSQASPDRVPQEDVIARMEEANAQRRASLASFRSHRRYFAANSFLRRRAYLELQADFAKPEEIRFQVLSRGGSRAVENRVFQPMLETEQANLRLPARNDVEICRRNYNFTFERHDHETRAFVFLAEPRTPNKYLFRGKIWVDEADFAIRRIEGEPAKRPSFWVSRTHFVHDYEKFGDFWFPIRNRTEVVLRLFGSASMGIDYYDYDWQPRDKTRWSGSRLPLQVLPLPAHRPAQGAQ